MSEEGKIKVLFPEGVETLTISKNDYDRLYGELTKENIELKLEIERLNKIIKEIYTKTLDTSITSLDLRDYIINKLGSDEISK